MNARLTRWLRERFDPVVIAAIPLALFFCFALFEMAMRFYVMVPDNGVLGAGVVEAHRLAIGLAVYEDPIQGHATWLYGPMTLVIGAGLFKLFGPSVLALRLVSFAASLATIAIGVSLAWRWLPRLWRVVAIASFFMIDCRVGYIASLGTDSLALCLAFAGLVLCSRAGWPSLLTGTVLLVIGTFTKQTAMAFAVVPLLVVVTSGRWPSLGTLARAALPLAVCGAVLVSLSRLSPIMWQYLVVVPRQYHIDKRVFLEAMATMIANAAPLMLLAGMMFRDRLFRGSAEAPEPSPPAPLAQRIHWVLCALAVGLPAGALSFAKAGGGPNSLMPVWYLLLALTWLLVARDCAGEQLLAKNRTLRALLLVGLAAMLFPTSASLTPSNGWRLGLRRDYLDILAKARTLPGSVVAPGDPSIMLLARGQHDRSLYADDDVFGWPAAFPAAVLRRDYSTDFVIETPKMAPSELDPLVLAKRGYRVVGGNANYHIWQAPAR